MRITNIILICGFGGSGKTSVGELLFTKLDSVAFLDADSVFIAKPLPIGEKMSQLKIENSTGVIQGYLQAGFQQVICVGLIWSQIELNAFMELNRDSTYNIVLFWLETSKDIRFQRALSRARDEADSLEFLEEVESKIQNPWPLVYPNIFTKRILTDQRSIASIVQEIQNDLDDQTRRVLVA